MSEYNYITKFVNYCKKNDIIATQPPGKNQSTYADCEIVLNENEILKVEAKMLEDTRSNSVHFYNLIGELIGTSTKKSLLQENEDNKLKQTCVAILLPYNSKVVFDKLWSKNITKQNGNNYCKNFCVKHLITFDDVNQKMKVYSYCDGTNRWV